MFQRISNSGKGESFLSPKECLWGPHGPLVSIEYTCTPGIKLPRRESNNSLYWCPGDVAQYKVTLVLRFHLNKQMKMKALRMDGTDSKVKGWLAAVQIGIVLLVKVSAFGIWCKLIILSRDGLLDLEVEGSDLQRKLII